MAKLDNTTIYGDLNVNNVIATDVITAVILCGTTCATSPVTCGTTCATSPVTCGTTCAVSPVTCGTTRVYSPLICGSTCIRGAIVCSTGIIRATGIVYASDGCSSEWNLAEAHIAPTKLEIDAVVSIPYGAEAHIAPTKIEIDNVVDIPYGAEAHIAPTKLEIDAVVSIPYGAEAHIAPTKLEIDAVVSIPYGAEAHIAPTCAEIIGVLTGEVSSHSHSSVTCADDSNKLCGKLGSQFLRSDVADCKTSGDLTFANGICLLLGNNKVQCIFHDGANGYIWNTKGLSLFGSYDAVDGDVHIVGGGHAVLTGRVAGTTEIANAGLARICTLTDGACTVGTHYATSFCGALSYGDSVCAKFGDDVDLVMYHDGSNGYIENITNNFQITVGGETSIAIVKNAGLSLFHNNNVVSMYTTIDGACTCGVHHATTFCGNASTASSIAGVTATTAEINTVADGTTAKNSHTHTAQTSVTGNAGTASCVCIRSYETGNSSNPILFTVNSSEGNKKIYEDSALYFNNTSNILHTSIICGSSCVRGATVCANNCGFAVDWIASSDRRIKDCIEPITSALSKVNSLCGVCYELCEDGTKDLGLIAQDVQLVEPRLVTTSEASEKEMNDYGIEKDGKLGLKYDKFAALFVEAIKELKTQNEELLEQMNCLGSNNENLLKRINCLESKKGI